MRGLFGASQVMLAVFVSFQGCGKAIRERLAGRPANGPAVGQPAPEIQGEDTAGIPFKLSDLRGNIVILSFWGDW
jgi:hypothetical protein